MSQASLKPLLNSETLKTKKAILEFTDFDLSLYLESFATTLDILRIGNVLTDINVVCKDGSSFAAHKVVLACSCPYFSKLFIPQDLSVISRDTLFMPSNVDSECFQIILNFMYTGTVKLTKDLSKIYLLLNLFKFLEVKESFKYVSSALQEVVDTKNFSVIWDLAEEYEDIKLRDAVTQFICKDIQCLAKLSQFMKLSANRLKLILDKCCTGYDNHKDILVAILAWGKEDPKRQTELDQMLRDFKFSMLSKKFLIHLLMEDPVVRSSKSLSFYIKRTLWDRGIRVCYFSPLDSEPDPGSKNEVEDFSIEDDVLSSSDSYCFSPHSAASAPIPKLKSPSPCSISRTSSRPESKQDFGAAHRWKIKRSTEKKKKKKKIKKAAKGAEELEQTYSSRPIPSVVLPKQRYDSNTSSSTTSHSLQNDCLFHQHCVMMNIETIDDTKSCKKEVCSRKSSAASLSCQSCTQSTKSSTSFAMDGSPRREKVILIFGRRRSGEACLQCFNLESNLWMPVKNINLEIPDNSATVYYHGGIYFLGGSDVTGNSMKSCMIYNIKCSHFEKVKPMVMSRSYAQATNLDRNIYVVGGIGHHSRPLSHVERYNVYSNSWQTLEPLPTWMWNMAVVTFHKKLLVLGGRAWRQWSLVCYSYDPEMDQWTEINYLPKQFSESYPLATVLHHKLFVIRYVNPNYIWEYDSFTNRWLRPKMEDGGPKRVLGILPHGDFLWVLDYAGKIFIYDVATHSWVRECPFSKSLSFPMYAVKVPWPITDSTKDTNELDWEKSINNVDMFSF